MEVKVTRKGHTTAFEFEDAEWYNDVKARRILEAWIDEEGSDGPGAAAEGWELTKLTTSPKHPGRVWVTFTSTDADPDAVDFRWDVVKGNGHVEEKPPVTDPPVDPAAPAPAAGRRAPRK